ncbi:sulfate/molybdate ABC transporter ATP-binding protein [Nocardia seriolae]|uniref:Molybdate-transporting ATPase n=1 Tax=Nocardia seriolae TaxID=37332 RepID=A0ABC8AKG9_9NOCA|nr:ATP-binding cassette domain-containing protein [Nocardia seriolae]APA94689.1 Molybdate-transporting ATPase [Nocardia seriolae]WKY52604.1 ATP-binding cassette domain-containing protein [Nocardia seriolae]WNJ59269.1 ATP-binding cassette domain-containing protein [Nocardia seriolae]BAW10787.1 molybdenum ABC transporter ATP-binding protein [Nocardia seriolae]BEK92071.1 ATP-binding cassette domain-containing protein [Nocardia seriolae]
MAEPVSAMAAGGLRVAAALADRDLELELEVPVGEVLAVLGPNGAGKSSLLDVVAGLVVPDRGEVRLGDRVLTDTAQGIAVPPHQRAVSLLAQDALLFPHLSVEANVAFGPRSRGVRGRAATRLARDWLRAVDAERFANRSPGSLSGGQAQRVALARALAVHPRVLLLDEPMAALDVTAAPAMRALLRRVLRENIADNAPEQLAPLPDSRPVATVLVTHDIIDAVTLADRVAVIEAGRVIESGPVAMVLARPRSRFAARIAGVNLILGSAVSGGSAGLGAVSDGAVEVFGRSEADWPTGGRAAAVFSPVAVAVHLAHPEGSPRNVFRVRVAELEDRGGLVRVRAADGPGAAAGLAADLTPAAVAQLGVAPGMEVYFAVKATEVDVYPY